MLNSNILLPNSSQGIFPATLFLDITTKCKCSVQIDQVSGSLSTNYVDQMFLLDCCCFETSEKVKLQL